MRVWSGMCAKVTVARSPRAAVLRSAVEPVVVAAHRRRDEGRQLVEQLGDAGELTGPCRAGGEVVRMGLPRCDGGLIDPQLHVGERRGSPTSVMFDRHEVPQRSAASTEGAAIAR